MGKIGNTLFFKKIVVKVLRRNNVIYSAADLCFLGASNTGEREKVRCANPQCRVPFCKPSILFFEQSCKLGV